MTPDQLKEAHRLFTELTEIEQFIAGAKRASCEIVTKNARLGIDIPISTAKLIFTKEAENRRARLDELGVAVASVEEAL